MKKYIALAVLTIGLFSAGYAISSSKSVAECNCSKTGICNCKVNCSCTSCEIK